MQSWSSQEAYAKGRPSEEELALRSFKSIDQHGELLELSFKENGGRKMVELRAASRSEAGAWFNAIEACVRRMVQAREIVQKIKRSVKGADESQLWQHVSRSRCLARQDIDPKRARSRAESTSFLRAELAAAACGLLELSGATRRLLDYLRLPPERARKIRASLPAGSWGPASGPLPSIPELCA